MTPYDPHRWTSHLFDLDGSMVREILGRVSAAVVWSGIVVVAYRLGLWFGLNLAIPITGHTLVGTVLGLLLVFRTNSSYDRFWEGRKQWGGIINESRNLARQSSVWLAADRSLMREIIGWTIAFPFATMQRLRHAKGFGREMTDLPASDIERMATSSHLPLAIARHVTTLVVLAKDRNLIDGLQLSSLDHNLQLLVDYCGACERIRSTPLPYPYAVHLRRILIAYCFTLPLALVADYGWGTIPATLLIAYALFGIEEIGVEIENPFGDTTNDLPLQALCLSIEATLSELMEDDYRRAGEAPAEQ